MYEGDVYVLPFEDPEFFKIVKPETEGFRVRQVGTSNEFALSEIGRRFVEEGKFIGNEFENPHTIDDYIAEKKAASEKTATSSIEEKIEAVEKANEELKESNETLKENIETMFEAQEASEETKEGEHEPLCSTDSDATNATTQNNIDESSTVGNGTDPEGNETETEADNKPTESEAETGAVSAEATTGKNVIVEVAQGGIPEVIANTAEEKQALLRVKLLNKHIDENKAQIITLEDKVEYHSHLASTLTYEPFIKLKNLVSEALHTNVDDENIKGIKERTKDFESIVNIQNLLKEHQRAADKAENDIADLEDEITKFEDEIAELNSKIDTFARQQKLPLDSAKAIEQQEEKVAEKAEQ